MLCGVKPLYEDTESGPLSQPALLRVGIKQTAKLRPRGSAFQKKSVAKDMVYVQVPTWWVKSRMYSSKEATTKDCEHQHLELQMSTAMGSAAVSI